MSQLDTYRSNLLRKKEELAKKVRFDFWEKYDEDHTVIRFATSWGTKMEDIDALIELL